ncbi:PREDICTED: NAC domain-containing protein 35-like [Tarenaya hassleriana]|uniref:NAC domain-containing protein 35-like n=1 Tax=Tarenaya hassleriana TaxID=28532 RepID=UPI00053C79A3|nr:PREDICTED: NAC domain-containing protein 35-like [Tarenaya hassleriana]
MAVVSSTSSIITMSNRVSNGDFHQNRNSDKGLEGDDDRRGHQDGHDDDNDDDDDDHDHDLVMPGFRFHPTEEELIEFYLRRKVEGKRFNVELITFLDLYRYDPWELPAMAAIGEKEWYFYVPRDRKYRNGDRPNRVTTSGYWKATGADRMIRSETSRPIGLKKTLVFYSGKAPKGIRTSWIMNEYRLPHHETEKYQKAEISLCRVYKRPGVEDHPSLPRSLPTRHHHHHHHHHNASSSSSSSRLASRQQHQSSNKNLNVNNNTSINSLEKLSAEYSGDGSTTTNTNTSTNTNNSNSDISIGLVNQQQQHPMPFSTSNSMIPTMAAEDESLFINNSIDELQRLVNYQITVGGSANNINQQYYQIAQQFHQQQQQQQQNTLNVMAAATAITPQTQAAAFAMNVIPGTFPNNAFPDRMWEMWNPLPDGNRDYSNGPFK